VFHTTRSQLYSLTLPSDRDRSGDLVNTQPSQHARAARVEGVLESDAEALLDCPIHFALA
jgi:hypothetical protein